MTGVTGRAPSNFPPEDIDYACNEVFFAENEGISTVAEHEHWSATEIRRDRAVIDAVISLNGLFQAQQRFVAADNRTVHGRVEWSSDHTLGFKKKVHAG